MRKDAVIDPTGCYRYWLLREWDSNSRKVVFIMLNPSRADATIDDPTLRRCISFAQSWGYGSLEVVNLFGYRATKPADLIKVKDPVGSENDRYLQEAVKRANRTILAWGNGDNRGILRNRCREVLDLLSGCDSLYCLGITKIGCPRHPLYVKSNTALFTYPS